MAAYCERDPTGGRCAVGRVHGDEGACVAASAEYAPSGSQPNGESRGDATNVSDAMQ